MVFLTHSGLVVQSSTRLVIQSTRVSFYKQTTMAAANTSNSNPMDKYHTFMVLRSPFTIEKKYQFIRELGVGAYGTVCACRDTELNMNVAIKKISKIFDKKILAKRSLRELKLLRHLNAHENIISIRDIFKLPTDNFEEIYLVQELMEADMHQIIRSQQPLTDAHYQYFLYQILRGLKYIHSANVLHRDLKPGNLLVNADCELKICDFGLARGFSEQPDQTGFMTEYVATRWYRAPEIMLSFQKYTKAIDIWSVGCIFAEMLGGKVLFAGRDYVHQLNLILGVLGTPSDEAVRRIGSPRAQDYVRSLPRMPKVPFSRMYPNANPAAIDLLEHMLEFDPQRRFTVEQCLEHPYLATYHDPSDEPVCSAFDFSFEAANKMDELKAMILEEIETHYSTQPNHLRRQVSKTVLTDANGQQQQNVQPEGYDYKEIIGPQANIGSKEVGADLEKELEQGAMQL